jgi:hypothetical protein
VNVAGNSKLCGNYRVDNLSALNIDIDVDFSDSGACCYGTGCEENYCTFPSAHRCPGDTHWHVVYSYSFRAAISLTMIFFAMAFSLYVYRLRWLATFPDRSVTCKVFCLDGIRKLGPRWLILIVLTGSFATLVSLSFLETEMPSDGIAFADYQMSSSTTKDNLFIVTTTFFLIFIFCFQFCFGTNIKSGNFGAGLGGVVGGAGLVSSPAYQSLLDPTTTTTMTMSTSTSLNVAIPLDPNSLERDQL